MLYPLSPQPTVSGKLKNNKPCSKLKDYPTTLSHMQMVQQKNSFSHLTMYQRKKNTIFILPALHVLAAIRTASQSWRSFSSSTSKVAGLFHSSRRPTLPFKWCIFSPESNIDHGSSGEAHGDEYKNVREFHRPSGQNRKHALKINHRHQNFQRIPSKKKLQTQILIYSW